MEEDKTSDIKTRIFDMSGLRLALYGLIITVININIQGFDIFPDVIGYILVIAGLGRIESYEANFNLAKKAAYILTVLAAINIYKPQELSGAGSVLQPTGITFSAGIFGIIPWLALLLMIAGTAANLAFTYTMCMGMKNLLIRTGDETLAGVCEGRWKLILIAQVGLAASMLLAFLLGSIGIMITVVFAIFAFIAMILFLLMINHTYRSVNGKQI